MRIYTKASDTHVDKVLKQNVFYYSQPQDKLTETQRSFIQHAIQHNRHTSLKKLVPNLIKTIKHYNKIKMLYSICLLSSTWYI